MSDWLFLLLVILGIACSITACCFYLLPKAEEVYTDIRGFHPHKSKDEIEDMSKRNGESKKQMAHVKEIKEKGGVSPAEFLEEVTYTFQGKMMIKFDELGVVEEVMPECVALGRQQAHTFKGKMGININDEEQGEVVIVEYVEPGGAADRVGIRKGAKIVNFSAEGKSMKPSRDTLAKVAGDREKSYTVTFWISGSKNDGGKHVLSKQHIYGTSQFYKGDEIIEVNGQAFSKDAVKQAEDSKKEYQVKFKVKTHRDTGKDQPWDYDDSCLGIIKDYYVFYTTVFWMAVKMTVLAVPMLITHIPPMIIARLYVSSLADGTERIHRSKIFYVFFIIAYSLSVPAIVMVVISLVLDYIVYYFFGMLFCACTFRWCKVWESMQKIKPFRHGPWITTRASDFFVCVMGQCTRHAVLETLYKVCVMWMLIPWLKYYVNCNPWIFDLDYRLCQQISTEMNDLGDSEDVADTGRKIISRARQDFQLRERVEMWCFIPHYPYPPTTRRWALGMQIGGTNYPGKFSCIVHTTHAEPNHGQCISDLLTDPHPVTKPNQPPDPSRHSSLRRFKKHLLEFDEQVVFKINNSNDPHIKCDSTGRVDEVNADIKSVDGKHHLKKGDQILKVAYKEGTDAEPAEEGVPGSQSQSPTASPSECDEVVKPFSPDALATARKRNPYVITITNDDLKKAANTPEMKKARENKEQEFHFVLSESCREPLYRVMLWYNNPFHFLTGWVEASVSDGGRSQGTEASTAFSKDGGGEHPMWLVTARTRQVAGRDSWTGSGMIDSFFDKWLPLFVHEMRYLRWLDIWRKGEKSPWTQAGVDWVEKEKILEVAEWTLPELAAQKNALKAGLPVTDEQLSAVAKHLKIETKQAQKGMLSMGYIAKTTWTEKGIKWAKKDGRFKEFENEMIDNYPLTKKFLEACAEKNNSTPEDVEQGMLKLGYAADHKAIDFRDAAKRAKQKAEEKYQEVDSRDGISTPNLEKIGRDAYEGKDIVTEMENIQGASWKCTQCTKCLMGFANSGLGRWIRERQQALDQPWDDDQRRARDAALKRRSTNRTYQDQDGAGTDSIQRLALMSSNAQ